ncbi:hypothetical protein ABIB40_002708 [Pedobacter sp. UYP30]|uniref:vanadium-dependent haloperoxidase n=1 Tax=Pedobacter sp. UYP30 TaxID=1756400 RepID=UPI003392DFA5
MYKIFIIFLLIGLAVTTNSCRKHKIPILTNEDISKVIKDMTEVMIHDVTNPPLAARFYAYTCLAGYEVVAQNDSTVKSMYGVLNDYPKINRDKKMLGYNSSLSAVVAMFKTAEKLQPSGFLIKDYEKKFIDSCRSSGFNDDEINFSIAYADTISKQILAYAKKDGYSKISNFPRYSIAHKPGSWELTPPAYIPPIEPYFETIRRLTLDSAAQFNPVAPATFSTNKQSKFYKLLLSNAVKGGKDLTQNEKDIANFWDCNPFAVQNEGHMMIGLKKISPGAHWMGIAGIACKIDKKSFSETMKIFTVESVGLLDAFITCWHTKFATNRIRPETAIRAILNPNWKPLLQTPPFPEYTSGHSVVSVCSATILTHYFGDNFKFKDDIEASFGIPPATFSSFNQAAKQAAISRFYGGIHFMDAIDQGIKQGADVGNWVLEKVAKRLN